MFIVERKGFTLTKSAWIWLVILCLIMAPGLAFTMHIHYGPKKLPKA